MNLDRELRSYSAAAKEWIEQNLERRPSHRAPTPHTLLRSDEDINLNRRLQGLLYQGGYTGITFPKHFGGQGLTAAHERAFAKAAAGYILPDLGGAGGVTLGPIAWSMMAHGSEEMCHQHIPRMLSGDEVWCQFYSEPEAGSDLAGIRSSAKRDGDVWVINGSKIWTTGAYYSDWAMCLARTDPDVPKHSGLTWFALPTNAPGVTIEPIVQIDGTSGFCQEFLDDVIVPHEHMIGELNQGWTVAQTMLVHERGGGAPMRAGAKTGHGRLAPDLVDLATTAGKTRDPVVRQQIARAHINDHVLGALGRRIVARLGASNTPNPAVAGYTKLASGTFAPIRARIGAEIAGIDALTWNRGQDLPDVAMRFLNGRQTAIASGTNEVQRNGIGERVLGLPREPSFDTRKPFSAVVREAHNWDHRIG